MGTSQMDHGRHDRIGMYVSSETFLALERHCAPDQSVDDLVELLLADETLWPDIAKYIASRKLAVYPVVDGYVGPHELDRVPVTCRCCPAWCRFSWHWRGQRRCDCTPERIAGLARE
jgi:hypothetical protein